MTTDCFACNPPAIPPERRLHDGVMAIVVAVIFVIPATLAAVTLLA